MEIMGLFQLLPRLVVFDLDYTLWPFYCECRSKRDMPRVYPHAKGILYALKDKGVKIAIASRSPTPDIANTFLDKLGIKSLFVAQERQQLKRAQLQASRDTAASYMRNPMVSPSHCRFSHLLKKKKTQIKN
ncbi:uncharacterized protein LOC131004361 [Salvia miltiorrhiza]|uniref:uncharacterized protein LOC131004361 n=1 Tax=Salvia miltiorrhiza TaxID=226208 RepID=UPI0025ABFF65|nr:uncharacterized protein LOC131004361 [Salvia miltiorrhiza]